jgi:hypothetical protein
MKGKFLVSILALVATISSSAQAATVTGRITYLDLNAQHLMLDNSDMYALLPGINLTGLEAGRLVTLDITSDLLPEIALDLR